MEKVVVVLQDEEMCSGFSREWNIADKNIYNRLHVWLLDTS